MLVESFSSAAAGGLLPLKNDGTYGAQFVADRMARYQAMVRNGNVFFASNSAVQALSVNSTTATGLVLSNPVGSGKNLIVLRVTVALASVPGAISEIVLTGSDNTAGTAITHTTPLTVRNSLMGSGAPRQTASGLADSAATIPTPAVQRALGCYLWIATGANVIATQAINDEVAGEIILGPGSFTSVQAVTTAISAISSITWAEELI